MFKFNPWIPPASGEKYKNAIEKHNKIAKNYENQYDTPYWKIYDKLTYDHMFENIENRKGLVLDAGGGTGKWARVFAKKGYDVIVLDLSKKMISVGIDNAIRTGLKNNIEFVYGDICNIPFSNKNFDVVLAQGNPVCYCNNPQKAISELSRVSKKNADVIISVHNKLAMIHYFYYLMGKVSFNDIENFSITNRIFIDYPIYAFTPDSLEKDCKRFDLETKSLVGKQLISGYVQSYNYLNTLMSQDLFDKTIALEKNIGGTVPLLAWQVIWK